MKKRLKKRISKALTEKRKPYWGGPVKEGVSQSLLHLYLADKERFRLTVIEGLRGISDFNTPIEFGEMWHLCQEVWSESGSFKLVNEALKIHCAALLRDNMDWAAPVEKWFNVCKVLFPIYLDHWKDHPREKSLKHFTQEEVFAERIELPNGNSVLFRGKFDGGVETKKKKGKKRYLKEHKSKGSIDIERIDRQLYFDLQTMSYIICFEQKHGVRLNGVEYDVVRRPLSGGKGNIRKKKGSANVAAETWDEYYERLGGVLEENADSFFFRWTVDINRSDITKFKQEFFYPVLANLVDDYRWWSWCWENRKDHFDFSLRQKMFPGHLNRHFRLPYGVWNPTNFGFDHELDGYLNNGTMSGLHRSNEFFPELE